MLARPASVIVLLLLGTALAGCGNQKPDVRLTLTVADDTSNRSYDLRCDPDGGSMPHAGQICRALARHPNMLVGGPGVDHSCPESSAFEVDGTYRGHRVAAVFSPCLWVPGQGDALGGWHRFLNDAPGGTTAARGVSLQMTMQQLTRRRKLIRRADSLRRLDLRLMKQRDAASANGRLVLEHARTPDRLAMRILRDLVLRNEAVGPTPSEARVFSMTKQEAVNLVCGSTYNAMKPVFVLAVRYSYVDCTGARRLAPDHSIDVLDAETLTVTDSSLTDRAPSPGRFRGGTRLAL